MSESHEFQEFAMPGDKGDYTMTLGEIIALGHDNAEELHLDSAHYPIFDENYRAQLNRKIVQHFALREIGAETFEMFRFYLGRTMDENMSYFNQLYLTTRMDIDPLSTINVKSLGDSDSTAQSSSKANGTQDTASEGSSTTGSKSTTSSESYDSEVPQTGMEDNFERYATHANKSLANTNNDTTSSSTGSNHSTTQSNNEYEHSNVSGKSTSQQTGYSGMSPADLIVAYRRAMLNIDMDVINSLESCFMGVHTGYDAMMTGNIGGMYYGI